MNELSQFSNEMEIIEQSDLYKQQLRQLKEVQDLTSEIEVQNVNSIIQFGQRASENISKISDELLASIKSVKSEEASEMLVSLTKIMDKFDIKEFENQKQPGLLSKIFSSSSCKISIAVL